MMEIITGVKDEKGNEHNRDRKYEVYPEEEGSGIRTRSSIKKRNKEDSPNDIQLISDATETMDILEIKVVELVKNTTS